jgi:hypothetical protein
MKKIVTSLGFLLSFLLLVGCAEPMKPEQQIAQSKDKQMMKAFLKPGILSEKEELYKYRSPDKILFRNELQTVVSGTSRATSSYLSNYDSSRDKIASIYIKTAKARGHIVKMYKNFVNAKIAKLVRPGVYSDISIKKFDLDPCFIEFDKNGRVVSALVRRHYFVSINNRGLYSHDRDSIILFGKYARLIERLISNDDLANGYITTL